MSLQNLLLFERFLFHACLLASSLLVQPGVAAEETHVFSTPSDDQWQYPFNFSPGLSTDRSVFSATTPPFDQRDAVALIRWDTSSLIPAGKDLEDYRVTRLAVRVWEPAGANWTPSATQVVQLFGVGFGPTYTAATWTESSAVRANGAGPPIQRDPYPLTVEGGRAENEASAQPWAAGVPDADTASARSITFDVDVHQPAIRDYIRAGLQDGFLMFAVSATHIPDSSMAVPGSLPRVIFKEGVPVHPGSSAPELSVGLILDSETDALHADEPAADVWQYPFNAAPGVRTTAPLFAAGAPFDFRDGAFVVRFDVSGLIPQGQDPESYRVDQCVLRVWNQVNAGWDIRGTTHVLELWGSGFGPTYTAEIWDETSPIRAGAPGPPVLRDPFPMKLDGGRAENDAAATPWAVGRPFGYNPGAQASPFLIQFDVDLAVPEILDYVRQGLSDGELVFHVTTNRPSGGSNPTILTRDALLGTGAGPTGGNAEAPELRLGATLSVTSSVDHWSLY